MFLVDMGDALGVFQTSVVTREEKSADVVSWVVGPGDQAAAAVGRLFTWKYGAQRPMIEPSTCGAINYDHRVLQTY